MGEETGGAAKFAIVAGAIVFSIGSTCAAGAILTRTMAGTEDSSSGAASSPAASNEEPTPASEADLPAPAASPEATVEATGETGPEPPESEPEPSEEADEDLPPVPGLIFRESDRQACHVADSFPNREEMRCLDALRDGNQERDTHEINRMGVISNYVGDDCWFVQIFEYTNPHFMPDGDRNTIDHEVRTIRFADPNCMSKQLGPDRDPIQDPSHHGFNESINITSINEMVARWIRGSYVNEDADFDIGTLYPPGDAQGRGACIRSRRHPLHGIAIEYVSNGMSITDVRYMHTGWGCGDGPGYNVRMGTFE